VKIVPPTAKGIEEAARAIRHGRIAAYPTETVYGLGADPFSEEALARLFAAKARDTSNPVLLIVATQAHLEEVAAPVSPMAAACMRAFWPGPLSLLLPKSPRVPGLLTANSTRVCVRWTSHAVARELCLATGHAITSTSANRAGAPPARSPLGIQLPGVDLCIDGGELPPVSPSTIYDPDNERILRAGAISEEEIRARLGR